MMASPIYVDLKLGKSLKFIYDFPNSSNNKSLDYSKTVIRTIRYECLSGDDLMLHLEEIINSLSGIKNTELDKNKAHIIDLLEIYNHTM